jgi:hypothetical protein
VNIKVMLPFRKRILEEGEATEPAATAYPAG